MSGKSQVHIEFQDAAFRLWQACYGGSMGWEPRFRISDACGKLNDEWH